MALKTFVKLNSITNLTEARYGAGMYVDLLGFNLDISSGKYINPELFKEITGWVSGVGFVGEFSYQSNPDILEVLKDYPSITWIEYDQIDGLLSIVDAGYSLIYKMRLDRISEFDLKLAKILSDYGILLHVASPDGSFREGDLQLINQLSQQCKVVMGAGVTEKNVLGLIDDTGIFGISLSGSEENKPGLGDLDELAEILEKIETEE